MPEGESADDQRNGKINRNERGDVHFSRFKRTVFCMNRGILKSRRMGFMEMLLKQRVLDTVVTD